MQSAKSYFNAALFRKNMTRFWPIWGVYLTIWLFTFPIPLILGSHGAVREFSFFVLGSVRVLGLGMAVFFSILAAMAVWSYLYNIRSAGLLHALPIRREGLFLTNYLSGLCFLVGPNVVIFILTLLAEVSQRGMDAGSLCMWLACITLMELFFFSFATFCAMFTGHILCLPAFYVILCGLPVVLVWLFDLTLSRFVYGYTGIQGLWGIAEWLTPIGKLAARLWVSWDGETPWLVGLGYIIIYAFFGLILAGIALAVYRRREIERAGDVVTVPWMRPVFRYGVAFCSALSLGTMVFELFRYNLPDTAWTLLFFMLLCGIIGYFVAGMLLEKSFRVLHTWKGCVPFLCALVLLVCVMEFDLTGYERRVPDPEDVAEVTVYGAYSAPYDSGGYLELHSADPEIIQAVTELHRAIAAAGESPEWAYGWEETEKGYSVQTGGMSGIYLNYTLENGRTITRDYYECIPIDAALLADPDSPAARLNTLINLPQVVEEGYTGLNSGRLAEVKLTYQGRSGQSDKYWSSVSLPVPAGETLRRAVLADLAEGSLGRRYLLEDAERKEICYVNDLEFTFLVDMAHAGGYTSSGEGSVSYASSVTVGLQTTAVHTLAALEELGVLEGEVQLLTHAEVETADRGEFREPYDDSPEDEPLLFEETEYVPVESP